MARVALIALLLVSRAAAADVANHDLIRAHVATLPAAELDDASHLTFSLRALVPIWGSYRLDDTVFCSVRPAAVAFDWILGGAVPAGLAIAALATDDAHASRILAWTALGLYATTRLGVLVIGNLHIAAYNHAVELRLAPTGVALTF